MVTREQIVKWLQLAGTVLEENKEFLTQLDAAIGDAEQGMKDTISLVAKKGRASYLGERSIGHQDPGATSLYLILKALYDTVS